MWRDKVLRVVGALSQEAWRRANHDKGGKRYKKHRPYALPEDVQALIRCLDQSGDAGEQTAKEIMERLRREGTRIDEVR
jgi:hypothetical protein